MASKTILLGQIDIIFEIAEEEKKANERRTI